MSFTKARERQLANAQVSGISVDAGLMCRMPGCNSRWTVDIAHGRVCSKHDEALSRVGSRGQGIVRPPASVKRLQDAIPLRPPVRPFSELVDDSEDA